MVDAVDDNFNAVVVVVVVVVDVVDDNVVVNIGVLSLLVEMFYTQK